MAILQNWDNALADHIGQARLPLSFGLANAVQFVSGPHPSDEVSNPATDMVHTLESKMLHTHLFTAIKWSSPEFQPAKVFHFDHGSSILSFSDHGLSHHRHPYF